MIRLLSIVWRALWRNRSPYIKLFAVAAVSGTLIFAAPFILRTYTSLRFDSHIYTVETVDQAEVAVVFGARVMPSGRLSTMLADRVRTGVDLYHAGKVDYLLMTGDNREANYDEPGAMRAFAIRLGVPPEAILTDPLGLRTYDSCYRAKEEYGITNAILVTQDFHLDRALFICHALGIEAQGVYADYHRPYGYSDRAMGWSQWREVAATSVAFADVLMRPTPQPNQQLNR